ncbi:MAG: VWA domain-containing protein [Bacteroidales bacterium]|nr:VWA domain-containing protein [Bacteroidales bacterium]
MRDKFFLVEIVFKYSILWLIPAAFISGLLVYFVYFFKKNHDLRARQVWLLSILRFSAFMAIAVFLLSPLIKSKIKEIERPLFVVAVDNSQSMAFGSDSISKISEIKQFLSSLQSELKKDFDVEFYSFGEEVNQDSTLDFNAKTTNLSAPLIRISTVNRHRSIGGLILVSDGIFNRGSSPVWLAQNMPFPIYTFGIGDTVRKRDLIVSRLITNDISFVGDRFPIQVDLKAIKYKNSRLTIQFLYDDKIVETKEVLLTSDYQVINLAFYLKANQSGLHKISIRVLELPNEVNRFNNVATRFVEVIDNRQKILMAYKSPHPDIGAITRVISRSDNYELDQVSLNSISNLQDYNLLILHGLPDRANEVLSLRNQIEQIGIPYILFVQADVNLNLFNSFNTGLQITSKSQNVNQVQPVLNESFSSFQLNAALDELMNSMPPIFSPYGVVSLKNDADVLYYQKIGNVVTDYPLLTVSRNVDKNNVVVLGHGIWKWWLKANQISGTSKPLDELVLSLVRTTSLKVKKERFNINYEKQYFSNDNIRFRAYLYNAAFQLVNQPDVNLRLTNIDTRQEFDYLFSKIDNNYELLLGNLEPGRYTFNSSVKIGNEEFIKNGLFVVQPINAELLNTEANFSLLHQIADNSGGSFYPNLAEENFLNNIASRADLVNTTKTYYKYSDLIDIFWLLFVLAGLFSIEWFLRKYFSA